MLIYEFVELIETCRELQRQYFKGRDPEVLRHCKTVEKQLDAVLSQIDKGELTGSLRMKPGQKTLGI